LRCYLVETSIVPEGVEGVLAAFSTNYSLSTKLHRESVSPSTPVVIAATLTADYCIRIQAVPSLIPALVAAVAAIMEGIMGLLA
jgi:hypothetical protein